MDSAISSHPPEETVNRCPGCAAALRTDPFQPPGEGVCPQCGHLLWFVQTSEGMRFYDARVAGPLEARVLTLLCETLHVKQENVAHSTSLETDLGADSLTIVEVVMTLEEKLGIIMADEDTQKIKTVGDLLDYILRHKPI